MLCQWCQEADDAIIYDGRDPIARSLADWWDEHQAADRARVKAEQEKRHRHLEQAVEVLVDYSDGELAAVGLKRIGRV
jgi:hypothetical protein